MKTKLLSIVMLGFISVTAFSQSTVLYGTAFNGGVNGGGTIFVADANGNNFHPVYSFIQATGRMPQGGVCMASNGSLYGVTELGGYADSCVCWRHNPITGVFTDVHDLYQFMGQGYGACSKMMNASDGMLYGLCPHGGANSGGVIYRIDPNTDIYTDMFDFTMINGAYAYGSLMQASDGNLYGTTQNGGTNGLGVIFSYNPASNVYTKLYVFSSATGGSPYYGGLIEGTDGKLYGMTKSGGANNLGVVFSYDVNSGMYSDLYDFDGINGSQPWGGLVQATDGKLYGMTYAGGTSSLGVVFSYDVLTDSYTKLVDFSTANGAHPTRTLTQGSNGKLFGVTQSGGTSNQGVAFSYDITSSAYTVLTSFNSTTGSMPDCEIVEASGDMTTSISTNAKPLVSVYPNPAKNSLSVSGLDNNSVLEITDVLGREIEVVKSNTMGKTIVDITNYPSVFFVKVNGETTKVVRN